ncbi:Cytochrome c domain-containing protein [Burkholderia multivorans]
MSEAPHKAPVQTPKQLIAVIIASFVIPIALIILFATYANQAFRFGAGTDALSDAAVARRVAPIAQVVVQDTGAAAAAPASSAADAANAQAAAALAAIAAIPKPGEAPAAAPTSADAASAGKALYQQVCQACHATGVLNAPKFGNKDDWAPRLKDPMDKVYDYALHGKGAMPPKGGSSAPDADVKAAVDYMVNATK